MRRFEGRHFSPGLALACWLLLAAVAAGLSAQAPAGQPLRQQVEERFEVLPISGGLLLRPKADFDGIRALEVRDGELAIDGREADVEDLERRVGRAAAAPVVSLLELDEDEIEELFALAPAEAEPDAAAAAAEAPADADRQPPGGVLAVPPIPPMPPIPPGLPDEERERLERDIERRQEEMRQRIEDAMERSHGDMERAQEEMEREWRRARRHSSGDARVVVGSPVRVREGEVSGEVVALGGGLGVDGEVLGDAVAIGGHARIDGTVNGSVVSVGGGVRLGPNARVLGDVVCVGGPLDRDPGAEVAGEVTEVSMWQGLTGGWNGFGNWRWGDFETPDYFDGSLGRLVRSLVSVLVLVLLGVLIATMGRHQVERLSARVTYEPLKTIVVGALAVVLFIPLAAIVAILLAVSVVGIPLLLLWPFAVLACLFLAWFGYFAAAHAVGQWSERRFGWRTSGPAMTVVLGLVLLHVWLLTARIIDVVDSSHDFGGFLRIMLWLFWALANLGVLAAGIGALLVKRRSGPAPELVPYTPPQPPGPTYPAAAGPTYAAAAPVGTAAAATGAAAATAAAPVTAASRPAEEPAADAGAVLDAEEEWEQRSWDEPFAPLEQRGGAAGAPFDADGGREPEPEDAVAGETGPLADSEPVDEGRDDEEGRYRP